MIFKYLAGTGLRLGRRSRTRGSRKNCGNQLKQSDNQRRAERNVVQRLYFGALSLILPFHKFLMDYIKKHDFQVFGWYRIVLGIVLLLFICIISISTKSTKRLFFEAFLLSKQNGKICFQNNTTTAKMAPD